MPIAIRSLSRSRLRLVLGAFFLALALPAAALVAHAYDQLKWEAFHRARALAEELGGRVDSGIAALIAAEEARSFADYRFLIVRGDARANVLGPSPLASFPVRSDFPGLVGHFQIDPAGRFSTPLLPDDTAVRGEYLTPAEQRERTAARDRIFGVLAENQLVSTRVARETGRTAAEESADVDDGKLLHDAESRVSIASVPTEAQELRQRASASAGAGEKEADRYSRSFDELKKSATRQRAKSKSDRAQRKLSELRLDQPYPDLPARDLGSIESAAAPAERRAARKEISQVPAAATVGKPAQERATRIRTFESELDPFELSLLDEQHLVLYRKVWRDGQRWVQGALIDRERFLDAMVGEIFARSTVATFSSLVGAWQEQVLGVFPGREPARTLTRGSEEAMSGTVLYRTRLSAPVSDLELLFTITSMPAGAGARVVVWVAAAFAIVLIGGIALMYRLGCREIDLARQQQDFVAAVSHELRTPLTSIRMYGEMLREGWTSEEKKRGYYDFIVQESERLSRLIGNVLQLARMSRNETTAELRDVSVAEALDGVRSKVASQVGQAGFQLEMTLPEALDTRTIRVEPDGFFQIFINLVDNALKFSRDASEKRIEIRAELDTSGRTLRVLVRDHGPGIERDQMKKIFQLFYRSENELTRDTVGTGIGLALVKQLAASMNARIEVRNASPGAEFSLEFPMT